MRQKTHRIIYVALLCLLGMTMTTSVFASNLLWFLLFVNWCAEWNWRNKFAALKESKTLQAIFILAAIHIIWGIGNNDTAYYLHDLQCKMPLVAIPLVIFTSAPLSHKEKKIVVLPYLATILAVSIVGFINSRHSTTFSYREIIPHISHIRYALNACLSICILIQIIYHCFVHRQRYRIAISIAASCVILWIAYFLTIIQSYTAIVVLSVLIVETAIYLIVYTQNKKVAICITALATVAVMTATAVVASFIHDYYSPTPLELQPLKTMTANGKPYTHCNDGIIENGGQINNYVCVEELRSEWQKRSTIPFDGIDNMGHDIKMTLIRYLGSCGLTKDSAGVASLSDNDITNIEQGIANNVYAEGSNLRRMVYRLLFEYEMVRVNNYYVNSSFGERILLWENAWEVFCEHPLLGTGTGDVPYVCHEHLKATQSQIAGTEKHIHNQYLTFLVAFGLIGFSIIVAAFVRALMSVTIKRHLLLLSYLIIIAVSFINEDTLETLAGILFCTVPIAFLRTGDEQQISN